MAIYLHELDHEHGSDYSAEFSYALTDTLGLAIKNIILQPEIYQKLKKDWNESLKRESRLDKIKNFLKLWSSFLSAGLLVYILKILVQRPRPLINLIEASNSSFPSGHTTIMFALFPIICKNFKEIRYFWLFISILVAFSRIYLGVHHLSDIMGGIILGLLVGINIINLFNHKLIK